MAKLIVVAGLPGAGKTTAARLLADALGIEYYHANSYLRELHKKEGSQEDFGIWWAKCPLEFDKQADAIALEKAKTDIVLEGRFAPAFCKKAGLDYFGILFYASKDIRAERSAGREGQTKEDASKLLADREDAETKKSFLLYDCDWKDEKFYHLKISTENKAPEEIVTEILENQIFRQYIGAH